MDPITTAILAAVASGATSGATKVGEQAISDAYVTLKGLLGKKFGSKSKVVKAVKELESNPKSTARKAVIQEELESAKADRDAILLKAAQELLKTIKSKPGGNQIIQMAMGDQNVQITGNGNTVNVNSSKPKRK